MIAPAVHKIATQRLKPAAIQSFKTAHLEFSEKKLSMKKILNNIHHSNNANKNENIKV
jgi:hypothetical protein